VAATPCDSTVHTVPGRMVGELAHSSSAMNEGKQVGIVWKLRTPEGKLVFIQVGQVRFALDEDEFTKITPHILLATDSDPIVCALLGGAVASP
jgi:hypothetical protein